MIVRNKKKIKSFDKSLKRVYSSLTRIDPTRTITLRRQFQNELTKRINSIRRRVYDLIAIEDAFGIGNGTNLNKLVVHGGYGSGNFGHSGRFGKIGGSGDKKDKQESIKVKVTSILEKAKSLPSKLLSRIKSAVQKKFIKLEKRYGRKYAKAIIGAALLGLVPPIAFLPGSMAITAAPVVALAELHRLIKNEEFILTESRITQNRKLTPRKIRKLAKRLYVELAEELDSLVVHGGEGSGYYGHEGRLGKVGGSKKRSDSDLSQGNEWENEGDFSMEHWTTVDIVVKDTAKSQRYYASIDVLNTLGKEFEVGGHKWYEAGNCDLNTKRITIFSPKISEYDIDTIRHITAHEIMHAMYERVINRYNSELREIGDSIVNVIDASGELKPEYTSKYPTYARIWRFREGDNAYIKLTVDDGITDYSKAYWADFAAGKVSWHLAVHETLAEIAGLHAKTGIIHGSKIYRDLYKAVRDEYRVIIGRQKVRKGVGVVKNESIPSKNGFTDHTMYLDKNFQPTTAEKAIYLRWWKADGTNGFAVKKKNESATDNVKSRGGGLNGVSNITINNRWRFLTSKLKLDSFQRWLRQQFAVELFGKPNEQLWTEYIKRGFAKGAGRAFDDTSKIRRLPVVSDFYRGSRQSFLRDSFNRPETKEKVQLLAGRVLSDLQGITESIERSLIRVLTDGLVQGKNPYNIARETTKEIDSIGINRARTIARTEIIRAHAEGQLDSMEKLGVTELGVMVEWNTSQIYDKDKRGNPRSPCKVCMPLEGIVLKLDEAKGLIPRHPNCMCSFIPANIDESEYDQVRSKQSIQAAVKRSVKAEVKDASKSRWIGADLIPDKDRPKSILGKQVKGSEIKNVMEEILWNIGKTNSKCKWITIRGRHICIDDEGRAIKGSADVLKELGENIVASQKEIDKASKLANQKIENALVPSKEEVIKSRKDLQSSKRRGGESRGGGAKDRQKQRYNLFLEFDGKEKGYVVCPWTGIKMHWTDNLKENPHNYPKFERGKIFIKYQGGGYQLHNLLPESSSANRARGNTPIRDGNLDGYKEEGLDW